VDHHSDEVQLAKVNDLISNSNHVICMLREGHGHSQNLKGFLFCNHSVNLTLRKGKRETQNTADEEQLALNTFIKLQETVDKPTWRSLSYQ